MSTVCRHRFFLTQCRLNQCLLVSPFELPQPNVHLLKGMLHITLKAVMSCTACIALHILYCSVFILSILLITVHLASSVVTEALLFWVSWLHMASPGPVCHQSEDECPDGLVRIETMQTHYELDVSDSQVYHNSIHAYSFIISIYVYSLPCNRCIDWCGSWWGILLMQCREVCSV